MKIALREILRKPGRFVAATAILTFISLLLLFLGGLLDGLISRSVSGLEAQQGDLMVFSSEAESSLLRSRIPPATTEIVSSLDGVRRVGGLGVSLLGARVPGNGPRDLADVALFGYEIPPRGVDAPPPAGKGIADDVLRSDGVDVGTVIELGPARIPVEIVGLTSNTSYNGQSSVWVSPETWRDVQNANRPDARVGDDVFQALLLEGDGTVSLDSLISEIDSATDGTTSTLTVTAAVDAIPGVNEQRSVFNQITGVTLAIAVVVVALFFALLTVERTSLYGVLKAIGGRNRTLFAGVLVQAFVVTAVAAGIGSGLALAMDQLIPAGSLPFDLSGSRVVANLTLLLLASTVGCAFSLRRVLRIDPASAIGRST